MPYPPGERRYTHVATTHPRAVRRARRHHGPVTSPFQILAVCTGNVCRSPAVERLLLARFADAPVVVASAGTHALAGSRMTEQTANLLVEHGANPSGFVARQLTAALVRDAALVLALTREHRARVVDLDPSALRRTFTLRELGRIVASLDPDDLPAAPTTAGRLTDLVALAPSRRGPARTPADDDVADPYGRPLAAYRDTFAQIVPAVDAIATAVISTTPA